MLYTQSRLPVTVVLTINFYDKYKAYKFEKYLKSETKYKGWESGTVYRSKNNDGYVLEIRDANNNNKITTYRFDAQGKAIPDRQ